MPEASPSTVGTAAASGAARLMQMREVVLAGLRAAENARSVVDAYLLGVCTQLRWPAAIAYVVDPASPRMLTPTHQAFLAKGDREEAVHIVSLREPAANQRGLGARVLETGEPQWIPDLTRTNVFTASHLVDAMGARGALAVPVYIGNRLSMVIEFYTRDPFEPDPATMWSLSYLMSRLGHRVFELNQAEMGSPPEGAANM